MEVGGRNGVGKKKIMGEEVIDGKKREKSRIITHYVLWDGGK